MIIKNLSFRIKIVILYRTYYPRSINLFYWTCDRLWIHLTCHDMIYGYKNTFIMRTNSTAPSLSGPNWTLVEPIVVNLYKVRNNHFIHQIN